ncbi:MAG TPA: glycosyltransferase family 87 protein [Candidatus Sulfotelmatobacter sp.]|nr:glycosyltransferase family 87 protein [Candidatus Sulfotelmatobacter sp.]
MRHFQPSERVLLAALLGLGLLVTAVELAHTPFAHPLTQFDDLRGTWCAGHALASGADPYHVQPDLSCQHGLGMHVVRDSPNMVLPFVLPGWDTVAFSLLARLPFPVAIVVHALLSLAALVAAIVLLVRVLRVPLALAAAGLTFAVAFQSLTLGQIGAYEVLAVVATGAALHLRADRWAGVFAAAALIEPHIGVAVGLATLAFVPRARLPYLAAVAGLIAIALWAIGVPAELDYVLRNIPQQARGEAGGLQQFSVTFLARWFGAPTSVAIALGSLSTILMLGVGLVLAVRLAPRERSALALIPASCVVLGGTYVHLTHIAAAIPGALLLVGLARTPRERVAAGLSVILLAVPWYDVALVKQLLPPTLTTIAVLTWALTTSWRATVAAVALCWLALLPVQNRPPAAPAPMLVTRQPDDAPGTQPWLDGHRAVPVTDPWYVLVKIPTWAGLLLLVGAAFSASTSSAGRTRRAARPSLVRGSVSGAPAASRPLG